MPCSSPAIVWITETEHQVFLQTGYHVFLRHASALYMHADLAIHVQNLHAYIVLKRVGGKHGILSEEKLGVLFQ